MKAKHVSSVSFQAIANTAWFGRSRVYLYHTFHRSGSRNHSSDLHIKDAFGTRRQKLLGKSNKIVARYSSHPRYAMELGTEGTGCPDALTGCRTMVHWPIAEVSSNCLLYCLSTLLVASLLYFGHSHFPPSLEIFLETVSHPLLWPFLPTSSMVIHRFGTCW